MPDHNHLPNPSLGATRTFSSPQSGDSRLDRFQHAWHRGQKPRIENYVGDAQDSDRSELLLNLLVAELSFRRQSGESPNIEQYLSRFPEDRDTVAQAFSQTQSPSVADATLDFVGSLFSTQQGVIVGQGDLKATDSDSKRYRKDRKLGEGAFGAVWLAEDLELRRFVALKEPHASRLRSAFDIEMYLAEARVLASLDHPHIVPVYDVGRTAEGSCYVVSKLIDGTDLSAYVQQNSMSFAESASLVALIAEALQHTHNRGLVHRDIKPANILIDGQNRPYVTDFGLALRDEDFGKHGGVAGTPAYMSPEQARGESHLVDGRSDIFSLGVVLYELLCGTKPFQGMNWKEIQSQITSADPQPLSQRNGTIPKELERICLKALSKRAGDRYRCAADLAEDLRNWSSPSAANPSSVAPSKIVPKGLRSFDAADSDFFLELLPGPRDRDGLPEILRFWKTRIEEPDPDRTFRVGLVYGPSGCGKSSLMKAGLLPRLSDRVTCVFLEATPDQTESQLLHGLRRACPDLLREASLADNLAAIRRGQGIPAGRKLVLVIDQFEQWLYNHGAEQNSELASALRQCDGGRIQAVLLVRDDFWMPISEFLRSLEVRLIEGENASAVSLFDPMHARKVLSEFGKAYGRLPEDLSLLSRDQDAFLTESVTGLSQDGKVISVRLALFSDMMKSRPWTPTALAEVGGTAGVGTTFLEETFSSRTAPPQHRQHQEAARSVLRALLPTTGTGIKGHMRSAGELQEASGYADRPQDFAELVRILDSEVRLIAPVGSENLVVGVEKAAETSAPISAPSTLPPSPSTHHPSPTTLCYQLTHDYLVPSLRDWLTQKQRETRRGRAELRLQEQAATWNAKREQRFLPSLWEYLNIRTLTKRSNWSEGERNMMSVATRFHAQRSTLATIAIIGLIAVGLTIRSNVTRQQEAIRIEGLIGRLLDADPNQIPEIVSQLSENQELSDTQLASLLTPMIGSKKALSAEQKRVQLHLRMASAARDPSLVVPLLEDLLSGKVAYIGPIRELLKPYTSQVSDHCWNLLRDEGMDAELRFRAGLVLAEYAAEGESSSWSDSQVTFMAEQLVSANAEHQPALRDLLEPIRARLLPDLERIFDSASATEAERLSAANAFADYAASDVSKLSRLLAVATPEQYAVIYPLVAANPIPSVIEHLGKIAATLPPEEMGSVPRIPFGQRRANAAVTMLRLGEPDKVLPVFDWTDDPEALTQFIFRCKPRGIDVEQLLDLLDFLTRSVSEGLSSSSEGLSSSNGSIVKSGNSSKTSDSTGSQSLANATGYDPSHARYALLLAIGEYSPSDIPPTRREALVQQVADWYVNDPSSGVHAAAGWLLRQLGEHEIVTRVDQTPIPYSPDREWFTLAVTVTPTQGPKSEENSPEADTAGNSEKKAETDSQDSQSTSENTSQSNTTDSQSTDPTTTDESDTPSPSPKTFYYTFIVQPSGEYTIGSVTDQPDRMKDELRHPVTLTRPFALLDREVTFEELIAFSPQYAEFMRQLDAAPSDAGYGATWFDSVAFCRWLGKAMGLPESDQCYSDPESLDQEEHARDPQVSWAPRNWPLDLDKRGFRLPTESEWEVATRCGSRTAYGFGSDVGLLESFAWFSENSGKQVHPPKELRPSVRGLFDMHGSLYEWTHNWFGDFGESMQTDILAPKGGSLRVNRGGGWASDAALCRAAFREVGTPASRFTGRGFRLALSPSSQVPSEPESREEGAEPTGGGTEGVAEQQPEMP